MRRACQRPAASNAYASGSGRVEVSAPFTWAAFEALCAHLAERHVLPLGDFLAHPPQSPWVLLRFDVDYREAHAVALAERAAQAGLRGSFYFRCRAGRFDLPALRAVAAAGHEVGYHYETLDLCRGDFAAAAELLIAHVEQLRAAGLTIQTIAAHGSPPRTPTYTRNLDLLVQHPELLQRARLLGEATLSVDFAPVMYLSDAGWRWRRYTHYTPQASGIPCSFTELRASLAEGHNLYLTFHPHQWFARAWQARYFRARQRLGGRVIAALRQRWGPH